MKRLANGEWVSSIPKEQQLIYNRIFDLNMLAFVLRVPIVSKNISCTEQALKQESDTMRARIAAQYLRFTDVVFTEDANGILVSVVLTYDSRMKKTEAIAARVIGEAD